MVYPNIRVEMKRRGLALHQLADRLGLSLNDFMYKLYGKHEFTLYEIECLADLFGCSLDYLVGHTAGRGCPAVGQEDLWGSGKGRGPGIYVVIQRSTAVNINKTQRRKLV